MKATIILTIVALVSLAGCVKQQAAVGETQVTSGVVCPEGYELDDKGRCVEKTPVQFDVP